LLDFSLHIIYLEGIKRRKEEIGENKKRKKRAIIEQ
jgi:hypothetical protein